MEENEILVKINTKQELTKFRFWYLNEFEFDIKMSSLSDYLGIDSHPPKHTQYLLLKFDSQNLILRGFDVIKRTSKIQPYQSRSISLKNFQQIHHERTLENINQSNAIDIEYKMDVDIGYKKINIWQES